MICANSFGRFEPNKSEEEPLEWNLSQEGRRLMAAATQIQNITPGEAAAQVQHSLAMEDLEMTPQGKADMEDAVEGRITPDELVERTRARYGLD